MASRIFAGLDEATLLSIRDTARTALQAGRVTVSFSAPGLSGSETIILAPRDALQEVLFELQRLDPATYGRFLVTSRTYPRFQ